MKNSEDKYPSLTKENYWNNLKDKFPLATAQFCKWIDEYKRKVDWNKLFQNSVRIPMYQIKFHHLPFDMQRGILTRYFEETIPNENAEKRKLDCIEGCNEFFEAQNIELSLKEKKK